MLKIAERFCSYLVLPKYHFQTLMHHVCLRGIVMSQHSPKEALKIVTTELHRLHGSLLLLLC